MPKIVTFIIVVGLVFAALAAFNISSVNAREEMKFIRFSVLAEDRANYGVDKNSSTIPAVSVDIIEDKLHDSGLTSTIPIIKYTYLPSQTPKSTHHDSESQTVNQSEPHGNHENNGNAGGNQNQNQNNNGNNGSSQSHGQQKDKGTKTDKGSGNNSSSNNANNGGSNNSSGGSNSTADVGSKGKGNSSSTNK